MNSQSAYPAKPFPASYWLETDKILAGELPTATEHAAATDKLTSLLNSGIRVVINLLEIDEFEQRSFSRSSYPVYNHELTRLAKITGVTIDCLRFPIVDMGVPTTREMSRILDTIDQSLEGNKPVYLHCYAGLGRTGTVAGCWLVRHGMDGETALQELHIIRAAQGVTAYGISPQSDLQLIFVRNWNPDV